MPRQLTIVRPRAAPTLDYQTTDVRVRSMASSLFANAQRVNGALASLCMTSETKRRAILNLRMIREEAERLEKALGDD